MQLPKMVKYTGYLEEEVLPCARQMSKWVKEMTITASRRELNAVKKKYANAKYLEVSELDHPLLT